MSAVTYYVALPFIRDPETRELVAQKGHEAPSAENAMMRARNMAEHKAGAIAFSRTGDPEIGDFEDAVILGRYGETPEDLAGFTSLG